MTSYITPQTTVLRLPYHIVMLGTFTLSMTPERLTVIVDGEVECVVVGEEAAVPQLVQEEAVAGAGGCVQQGCVLVTHAEQTLAEQLLRGEKNLLLILISFG